LKPCTYYRFVFFPKREVLSIDENSVNTLKLALSFIFQLMITLWLDSNLWLGNHKQSLNFFLKLCIKLFHKTFKQVKLMYLYRHIKFWPILKFYFIKLFILKAKKRCMLCVYVIINVVFLLMAFLDSCCLCDVSCSDNNNSWLLCCTVRLFGWKTAYIFTYSILLVWHWEVYWATMRHFGILGSWKCLTQTSV
jgi:hypothetical protein